MFVFVRILQAFTALIPTGPIAYLIREWQENQLLNKSDYISNQLIRC